MECTENMRIGILDVIKIPRQMLLVSGMWPKRNPTIFYTSRHVVIFIWEMMLYVGLFAELHLNISEKDYLHLTELLSFLATAISYQGKRFFLVKNGAQLLDALDDLKQEVFKNRPRKTDLYPERQRKWVEILARSFQLIIVGLVLLYFVKPFFAEDQTAIRLGYDLGKWTFPFHCFQSWCIFWGCWNNSSLDILASGLISVPTSQFEILRDKLINVRLWAGFTTHQIDRGMFNVSGDMDNDVDARVNIMLGECVEHHLAIIKYCSDLESIFNFYFLVQFVDSVAAICNTWFQFILTEDTVKIIFLIFYTAGLTTQLVIYCFYGNNLIVRSEEIRDACYLSDWYLCGPRVRKSLMIIMERAKRPTVLTAGKLTRLSLNTFGSLMRSSYSYFALMNSLYGK